MVDGDAVSAPDWAVSLDIVKEDGITYRCTGSLVSRHWIMTAAHCVLDAAEVPEVYFSTIGDSAPAYWVSVLPSQIEATVGRSVLNDTTDGFTTGISQIAIHDNYIYYGTASGESFPCAAYADSQCFRPDHSSSEWDTALLRLSTPAPVGTNTVDLAFGRSAIDGRRSSGRRRCRGLRRFCSNCK